MITILTTPQTITPVYNDIVFMADSDNKTNPGFRYVCEVYVDDALVVTLKLFPNELDGTCAFRINKVLENYVSMDRHTGLSGAAPNPNSIIAYYVTITEEYTPIPGEEVINPAQDSDVLFAWNGVLQYPDFPSYDVNDWIPEANTSVVGQEELYNGAMVTADGGWPLYAFTASGGIGLSGGKMLFTSTIPTYANTTANTVTELMPTVSYDFSFDVVNTTGAGSAMALVFGSALVYLNLSMPVGTYTVTGTGTPDTFGAGQVSLSLSAATTGTITIDNFSIKMSATTAGTTWVDKRLLTTQGQLCADDGLAVHPGEEAFCSWLQYNEPGLYRPQPNCVRIRAYENPPISPVWTRYITLSSAEVIDTGSPDFPFDEVQKFMITAGVGPKNLAEEFNILLGPEIIGYEVEIGRAVDISLTEKSFGLMAERLTFRYHNNVTKFKTHRLEWLGRLGNMESYSFRLRDNRTVSSDTLEYTQIIPRYNGSTFGYAVGDRGRTVINNNVQERLSVVSEYMTLGEAAWIEELFTSPVVVEQRLAKVLCFSAAEVSGFYLTGDLGYDHGLVIGDDVVLYDGTTSGLAQVTDVTANVVQFLPVFAVGAGPYQITVLGTTDVLPCIVTSREFKNRDKKGSNRNISYTIEYERAYPLVVQRG